MEKMIGVINDNLKSVISGIKTHRVDTEKELSKVNKDIEDKAGIARQYGISIEDSKQVIGILEGEIKELESDLVELTDKFKNFTELLAAGNKEISNKILEKRTLISKETQSIKEVTEKAEELKSEIIGLETNKEKLEAELKKASVLERYYESSINSIIDFSTNHKDELDSFVVEEIKDELDVKDMEINEKDLNHEIDDSVFEEIDNIADDDDAEEADNIDVETDESETTDESGKPKELSIKDTLDNIISSGQDLEKKAIEFELEEDIPDVSSLIDEDIEIKHDDETSVKDDSLENEVEDTILGDNLFDEEKETSYKLEDDNVSDETINLFIPDDFNASPGAEKEENVQSLFNPDDFKDMEESSIGLNNVSSSIFDSNDDMDESLKELGLDKLRFSDEDIDKMSKNFNKDNTSKFLNIMEKHHIDSSLIYTSVDVLINVTPQNLDHILTLLEHTNATSEDISCVFNLLDKVNINKLEEVIENAKEDEIANLLFASMDYNNNCELLIKLGFTKDEEKKFRKNLTDEEFLIFNTFSDIVIKNFNTINALNVDNARGCLIEHPQRFIFNPSRFNSILDKYDKEDLIRCINKNIAVIDRL